MVIIMVLYSENRIVKISGNSMEPLLYNGDIAFVSKMERYFIGDVVIFKYVIDGSEKLLSHRLIFEDEYHYYCKGNNSLNIEEITPLDVLGKITSAERHEKKIQVDLCNKEINAFCELSRNCGNAWKSGNLQKAIAMSKRCYITMFKICNSKK